MTNQTAIARGANHPSSDFWDRIAGKYSRKPITDLDAYQTKLSMTQRYLNPEMDMLELGCGTGGTALIHSAFVRTILATDVSPAMIDIARKQLDPSQYCNVDFAVASVEEFTAQSQSFDVVLGLSFLHLLSDRPAAIRKVAGFLRPNGLFVTSTPCLADNMAWIRFIQPIASFFGFVPEFRIFSKDTLRQEMADAGFVTVEEFEPGDGRTLFMISRLEAE